MWPSDHRTARKVETGTLSVFSRQTRVCLTLIFALLEYFFIGALYADPTTKIKSIFLERFWNTAMTFAPPVLGEMLESIFPRHLPRVPNKI